MTYLENEIYIDSTIPMTYLENETYIDLNIPMTYLEHKKNLDPNIPTNTVTETYIDSTNSITNLETEIYIDSTISMTYLETEKNLDSTFPTNLETETNLDSTNLLTNLDSTFPTYLETETNLDSTFPTNLETETNLDSIIPTNLETETNLDSTIPTNLETETNLDSTIPTNLETETNLDSIIPTNLEIEKNLDSTIPTYLETETNLDSTFPTYLETETNLDSTIPTYLEKETNLDSTFPTNLETETNLDSIIPTNLETETNLDSNIYTNLETETNLDSTIPTNLEAETNLDSTNSITNLETEIYIDSTHIPTIINSDDNINIEEKECLEDQCILINSNHINIYLNWDYVPIYFYDLDLSLEGLDENNNLIEKVYFDNLNGFNGAINLNTDNKYGYQINNLTEIISINLTKIQDNIKSLIILINSFYKEDILNSRNAYISIYEMPSNKQKLINQFWLNNTKSGVMFFYGIIEKNGTNKWIFRKMYESFENTNLNYSYIFLEQYNIQKLYCNGENVLSNGTIIDLYSKYNNTNLNYIYVDLGWENYPKMILDLDIIMILFDERNNYIETVYYAHNYSNYADIYFYGDNRIGNNISNDETISIRFQSLFKNSNSKIFSIAVVINSFKGYKLNELKSAYIKLDSNPRFFDLYRCFYIVKRIDKNGLLFGFFKKKENSYLQFKTMIIPLEINNINNINFINNISKLINS